MKVDFFTQRLRPAIIHGLDAAGSLLVAIFGGLIAWRTAANAITVRAPAAGGTLGIMIPPSVPLVIGGTLTQKSIGKLCMAAVIPGLMAMVGYMLVVRLMVRLNPGSGPAGPRATWPQRLPCIRPLG